MQVISDRLGRRTDLSMGGAMLGSSQYICTIPKSVRLSSCCSACDRFGHLWADKFHIEQCVDGDVLISEKPVGLPRHEADLGPRAGDALDVA